MIQGDQLYIDFAGKTWEVYDCLFGQESSKKQVFVANLGYSQYGYVEVIGSQTTEDFIGVLRRCLEYLGGVPKCIVPDNLKAAVIKTDRYEPVLNRVLEDFAITMAQQYFLPGAVNQKIKLWWKTW